MTNLDEFFGMLNESGVNVSNSTRREIFKKELIKNLPENDAKIFRRKIRGLLISYAKMICKENGKNVKNINAFNTIYQNSYAVNDYSLSSICSDNMKEVNKEILKKALNFAKLKTK